MKDVMAATVILLSLLFGLPWLTAERRVSQDEPPAVEKNVPLDEQVTLTVWDGEKVQEMTVAAYLPGVVRGEMPATFELEALKAQAVTARTYLYYKVTTGSKPGHPDAAVCMSPDCCAAYTAADRAAEKWGDKAEAYEAKIQQAVQETDGQVMLYDGEPILAAFHSSSDGVTAASGDVWVRDLPYLTSVESPENGDTVPNYYSVKTFTAEEFQKTFAAVHADAAFGEDPAQWVQDAVRNGSDRVESVTIGGVAVEGTEVRSIFSLRSASFTVECTAQEVTFRVTGYGHGVGMSQYGANALAAEGKTWQEILHWYYTGVELASYAPQGYTK
ncbi:MAG: stage II sporulation protein D [Ruminococcaceae bacterium]|nr:stage II sporulation protein D [Oscillospiraceae bacterium]